MPATAGRVRMPHNNRMSSSAALKMTGIWKDTIGYDPYAAEVRLRGPPSPHLSDFGLTHGAVAR